MIDIKEGLLLQFTNFLIKSRVTNNKIKQNLQLAEELQKPVIRNFLKRVYFILDLTIIFGELI